MKDRNEITKAIESYLDIFSGTSQKPVWSECLAYLAGYFGELTVDMVHEVRFMQVEGKVK